MIPSGSIPIAGIEEVTVQSHGGIEVISQSLNS
jgi:hypothetical protein